MSEDKTGYVRHCQHQESQSTDLMVPVGVKAPLQKHLQVGVQLCGRPMLVVLGAGVAWPQSITYGTTIPDDSDLTFRTATGELVRGGKRTQIEGCDDWGSNLRVRGVQAPVRKPLLSVGEYTTTGGVTVLYGDKGYMFHKGSNVAKKMDAWVQIELRDSQYRGCTVAYKENNVYNMYVKPRENKIDAMPLSGDSESGGCRLGPNL